MQPRLELPTKGQINAIADIDAIRGLMDDVERSTVQMETDLEFRSDDDDWADRCRRALALHRYTFRLLGRRLATQSPMQETRERLFIDAAREALDRETYMAIWDRVDAMQQQDRAA